MVGRAFDKALEEAAVAAEFERRKSTEVVAKLVAIGDPSSAALMDSVSLTLKTTEKRWLPAIMTAYLRWSAVLGRVPRPIDLTS
jgi:hypothetical protein